MKKRIFVMFLAVLMGSQPVLPVLAESMEEVTEESSSLAPERVEEENETERERTEEEKLIEKMCDTDILETAFIGKSFWNDEENFEDIKEDLPQILLDYYESEGVDSEEMDAETLRELIDTELKNLDFDSLVATIRTWWCFVRQFQVNNHLFVSNDTCP